MNNENPDINWYMTKSKSLGFQPRCPIAAPSKCPRYFNSAIFFNKIHERNIDELISKWDGDCPPETTMGIVDNDPKGSLTNFCPEFVYDHFGLFATTLVKFDKESLQNQSEKIKVKQVGFENPNRKYWIITPQHYTQCREFSVLYENSKVEKTHRKKLKRDPIPMSIRWEILSRDKFTCTYCGKRGGQSALEIDHKKSIAEGGGNDIGNLVTSCADCNRGKGRKSITE